MITIPTISELYTTILSDLEGTYGDNIPLFGKNMLRAQAAVQAAKLKIVYLSIAYTQKNIFPDTADAEASGGTLERFGRVKLGRNPFPATAGQYTVEITGTIGSTISAGTTWKSNDDSLNPGKLFILDVEYELVAATDSIVLRALESGLDSQLLVDDELSSTSPIAGVDKVATVTAETVEPLSSEDIELYRQRTLEAYRLEAQGGSKTDYRLWAADAQGVQQVYPYAKDGEVGVIDLFVEATVADSTDGKGTPSAGLLLEVEEVVNFDPDTSKPLNERGRLPLGVVDVNYLAVSVLEVDIEIIGFAGVTTEQQTLIFNAIEQEISTIRPFIAGADILSEKNDILDKNKIIATILQAVNNASFSSLDLDVDSVGVSSYTFTDGDIPHLNSVTYS